MAGFQALDEFLVNGQPAVLGFRLDTSRDTCTTVQVRSEMRSSESHIRGLKLGLGTGSPLTPRMAIRLPKITYWSHAGGTITMSRHLKESLVEAGAGRLMFRFP